MADWHLSLRSLAFPCGLRKRDTGNTLTDTKPLQSGLPGAGACQYQSRWRIPIHFRAALHRSRNRKYSLLPPEHVSDGHRLRLLETSGSELESHAHQIREECHESSESGSKGGSRSEY